MTSVLQPKANIQKSSGNDLNRERNASRISVVLIAAFLPVFVLYLYFALQAAIWQLYALAIIPALLSSSALAAAFLSRRKQLFLGTTLMIGSIAIMFPLVSALQSGLGFILAISGMIGISMISALTLSKQQITNAMIVGAISSITSILIDFYIPFQRFEYPPIQPFLSIISALVIIVFTIFIAREFRNYSLRTKLIIGFVTITVIAVSTLAVVTDRSNRIRLTQDAGSSLTAQAESRALIVGETLAKELQGLQSFGLNELVQDRVERASVSYVGDPATIQSQIDALDKQWRAADAANNNHDPLVYGVLNEIISSELRAYRDTFPENVEVFVTDKYGANVGATNRTSDYYQADEAWWQSAYNKGKGAVYIGQPAFDESSATYASIIAIPLYSHNTNKIIGVLRTTVNLKVITDLLTTAKIGKTGQIELYVAKGQEIPAEGGTLVPGDPNALALPVNVPNYAEINYHNKPSLVSRAPVTSLDPKTSTVIRQLGWSLVVHQDRDESFASATSQTRTITFISLVFISLATLAAFFVSQLLAQPVQSLTAVAEQIASGDLGARASITTQDEIGALATSFNRMTSQLQDTLGGLERRVADRTSDLETAQLQSEKRAQELQAISEISRTIASEQRQEILLPLITRLVSEKFDFYHVGIFLLDETRQLAVLQAANSEGGQKMLERGHRLEVGLTGIVGNVAQTGQARIALDVGTDAVFFNNPDLPETRSEMALPLNIRDQIIGVLDVQSKKPGAFTQNDINTLGILADQVTIAIENARLFSQTQQALGEVQTLYRQYLSQEWKDFIKQDIKVGYRKTLVGGKLLNKTVESDEIWNAMKKGDVQIVQGENNKVEPSIIVPVKLRGQTIGVLNIKSPVKNRQWSQDEINLAQAVSDRLALALDNSRLLQDLQRRAAKEAKIGEVTAKIGASINMRNVLQTAVEELGRAMPGSEVMIQFQENKE